MATPSQTPETPATSTPPDISTIDSSSKTSKSEKDDVKILGAWVYKERLASDLSMLESGAFADFTVVCNQEKWNVHRFILNRCPYFKPMVSEASVFKEARELSITIEGFEPFEIGWLLEYIYSLQIDIEQAKSSSPNKSYLETCVLVWSLGDYFQLPELSQLALSRVSERCQKLFIASRCNSVVSHGISFLSGLEAGIRAAWRPDRVAGPTREQLMTVCGGLYPYLRDQPSFISLLDELPEFTAHFAKGLLGCPGMQLSRSHLRIARCHTCNSIVFDVNREEGKEFVEEAFVMVPNTLDARGGQRLFFCSKVCYNDGRDEKFKYTEELPMEA